VKFQIKKRETKEMKQETHEPSAETLERFMQTRKIFSPSFTSDGATWSPLHSTAATGASVGVRRVIVPTELVADKLL